MEKQQVITELTALDQQIAQKFKTLTDPHGDQMRRTIEYTLFYLLAEEEDSSKYNTVVSEHESIFRMMNAYHHKIRKIVE
jgi:hypothetical protein